MGLKGRLRRIERDARGESIAVEQKDGGVAYFPRAALGEAFLSNCEALEARANGEEPPEPHPLSLALMNAAQRESWHEAFFDQFEAAGPVEDLSE
ncbi:MAG: hypothetical protein M3N18_04655 [Actinomycetota bacterium]|nr:hypothetical protein [Actinomycetota bacterium]